ncbi:Dipeptidyl peptidase IV (DPP IV) N-terminal region [Streptomyces sp. TLI_053]|uniref:DPP IV N-terminal domain-containing protein n=1 Tax=Streptomyces sp. TLI_053 TaxID=1855352 RepID=UPI00087B9247|nr:DPP IV N-terminal domain-containing protein [Streptomyces sp. TLI_053]SDT83077.1 Dipeptidyl peptidase IV (DPP IV) N-terminal region [Streptomyces sp. TLI_053]
MQKSGTPGEPVVHDQVRPLWIDGGSRFWYALDGDRDRDRDRHDHGRRFVLVDPAAGTCEPAFDHARLAAALATASARPISPEALPLTAVRPNGNAVEFAAVGGYWRCRLDDYTCEPAEFTPPGDPLEALSPDGKVTVARRGHDLWARSVPDGREWALTTDGGPEYQYGTDPAGTADATLPHRVGLPGLPPAVAWSPDSTRVLTHRIDRCGVRQAHPVEARPGDDGAPAVHARGHACAGGGTEPRAELLVLDVRTGAAVRAQAEPQLPPITTEWAWWAEDGSAVYYLAHARDPRTLSLHRLDPATGEVTTVLSETVDPGEETGETGDTRVDPPNPQPHEPPVVRVLTDEVLWYSRRDGRGHLYRYDLHTGAPLGQVTSGPWDVRRILRVDEAARVVYFTATGRVEEAPDRRTVCRAALDGSGSGPTMGVAMGYGFGFGFGFGPGFGLGPGRGAGSGLGLGLGFGFTELTDDELDHAVIVADGQEYFIDSGSTVDTPPLTCVRDWTGRVLVELFA